MLIYLKDLKFLTYLLNTNDMWMYPPGLEKLDIEFGSTPFPEYGGTPQISDISPLANLKNLTKLYLGGNQISDISPLANLKLTHLDPEIFGFLEPDDLNSAELISDVSPLANLKNLTYLNLSNNQISDFSPIAGLIPNLELMRTAANALKLWIQIPLSTSLISNLRAAIEEALGKTSGDQVPITTQQIWRH